MWWPTVRAQTGGRKASCLVRYFGDTGQNLSNIISKNTKGLATHIKANALLTDGPFRLSSGGTSDWYLDGRQVTYSGVGGRLVAQCIIELLDPRVTAIGGLTMGADPIAIATAILSDGPLNSFSIRKQAKPHGTEGRIVGPLQPRDLIAVVDDTTTTGSSIAESISLLHKEGYRVIQAIVVVDRSSGAAAEHCRQLEVPFTAVLLPDDLGVTG